MFIATISRAEVHSKTGSLVWKIHFETLKSAKELWEIIEKEIGDQEWRLLKVEFKRNDNERKVT